MSCAPFVQRGPVCWCLAHQASRIQRISRPLHLEASVVPATVAKACRCRSWNHGILPAAVIHSFGRVSPIAGQDYLPHENRPSATSWLELQRAVVALPCTFAGGRGSKETVLSNASHDHALSLGIMAVPSGPIVCWAGDRPRPRPKSLPLPDAMTAALRRLSCSAQLANTAWSGRNHAVATGL